jgi:hypothetical protein
LEQVEQVVTEQVEAQTATPMEVTVQQADLLFLETFQQQAVALALMVVQVAQVGYKELQVLAVLVQVPALIL